MKSITTPRGIRYYQTLAITPSIAAVLNDEAKPEYLTPTGRAVKVWGRTEAEVRTNLRDLNEREKAWNTSPQGDAWKFKPLTAAQISSIENRLPRLYSWLNANGIPLASMSTDASVQRELPKMQAALAWLRSYTYDVGETSPTGRAYRDLIADLDNLTRRVPSARVTPTSTTTQGTTQGSLPLEQAVTSSPLVVAAQEVQKASKISGAGLSVVDEELARGYWTQISGEACSANKLSDALAEVGLEDFAPGPSAATAFRRAVMQAAGVGVRVIRPVKGSSGSYHVFSSQVEAKDDGQHVLPLLYRVDLDYEHDVVSALEIVPGFEGEVADIQAEFAKLRKDEFRSGAENTQWMRRVLIAWGAVVTPHNGTLFLKSSQKAKLDLIRAATTKAKSGWFTVLPVRDLGSVVEEVLNGLQKEAAEFVEEAERFALGEDGTERRRKLRASSAEALKERIKEYENLFGRALETVHGQLEGLRVKLSGAMVVADAVVDGAAPITTESDAATKRMAGVVGEVARDEKAPAKSEPKKGFFDELPEIDKDDGTANRFANLDLD